MADDKKTSGFVIETLKNAKKSIVTGLVVRIVLLAVILLYMSWLYSKISQVNADTVVSTARHKIAKELPSLAKQLSAQLKEQAPSVIKKLEDRSLEAIPEVGAILENRIKARLKEEMRPMLEEELTNLINTQVTGEFERLKKAHPDLYEEKMLDLLTDHIATNFEKNAINSMDIALEKINYWGEMNEINDWLIRLQKGESLSEKEMYERELIGSTLKMINIKTGGGLVPKKK